VSIFIDGPNCRFVTDRQIRSIVLSADLPASDRLPWRGAAAETRTQTTELCIRRLYRAASRVSTTVVHLLASDVAATTHALPGDEI